MLKAFSYMFKKEGFLSEFFIVFLITLIPLLGSIFYSGYLALASEALMDNEALPDIDFGNCFLRGLLWDAAALVLGIVVLALFAGVGTLVYPVNRVFAGIVAGLILLVFVFYIYPAIFCNFVREGTFASCFDLKTSIACFSQNLVSYLKMIALGVLMFLVLGVLIPSKLHPLAEYFIFALISTYVLYVAAYWFSILANSTPQIKPQKSSFLNM